MPLAEGQELRAILITVLNICLPFERPTGMGYKAPDSFPGHP